MIFGWLFPRKKRRRKAKAAPFTRTVKGKRGHRVTRTYVKRARTSAALKEARRSYRVATAAAAGRVRRRPRRRPRQAKGIGAELNDAIDDLFR